MDLRRDLAKYILPMLSEDPALLNDFIEKLVFYGNSSESLDLIDRWLQFNPNNVDKRIVREIHRAARPPSSLDDDLKALSQLRLEWDLIKSGAGRVTLISKRMLNSCARALEAIAYPPKKPGSFL